MASGFMKSLRLVPEVWIVAGWLPTDSSGDPDYADDGSVTDQYGEAVTLPPGLSSVTRLATGLYRFTFTDPWWKMGAGHVFGEQPKVQGRLLGTVAITSALFATLNTKTLLITTSGSGGEQTITFTTPSSVQDIADQINAGIAPDAAEILTDDDGNQYLSLYDVVFGSASSVAVNATSTADTVLGISNTASAGKDVPKACILRQNPRAESLSANGYIMPGKTIDVAIVEDTGLALSVVSGALRFSFEFVTHGVA